DVVAVEEGDRAHYVSSRFDLAPRERRPDQVPQCLRTASVTAVPHESVERLQERSFERDADSSHGHGRPQAPKTPRPQEGRGLPGLGLVAYAFGPRHGVDADHIVAIDNTTRKLLQDGQRPFTVGTWFSLGHSAIVFILTVALVVGTRVVVADPAVQSAGQII